ncbi:MAG: hypothetical protein AB7P40_19980 [Chloroflexota bacterium]
MEAYEPLVDRWDEFGPWLWELYLGWTVVAVAVIVAIVVVAEIEAHLPHGPATR